MTSNLPSEDFRKQVGTRTFKMLHQFHSNSSIDPLVKFYMIVHKTTNQKLRRAETARNQATLDIFFLRP